MTIFYVKSIPFPYFDLLEFFEFLFYWFQIWVGTFICFGSTKRRKKKDNGKGESKDKNWSNEMKKIKYKIGKKM